MQMASSKDTQTGQVLVNEDTSIDAPDGRVTTGSENSDYNESEDYDYDPTAKNDQDNDNDNGDSDDDQDFQQESNFDKLGLSAGGLIKTRRQREAEKHEKQEKRAVRALTPSVDIDSVWEQLRKDSKNTKKKQSPLSTADDDKADDSSSNSPDEMITIETSYEFAGKTIFQTKKVHVNSAEAKAYLNSVKLKNVPSKPIHRSHYNPSQILSDGKVVKRMIRRKRPSLIDKIISDPTASKLSTLEKSRLDWARYVDKHGIDAQLKTHNKGGYLEKQDFLARVDQNKDKNYREAKTASAKD
ncbi:SWR1-complex protein 5 [Komagataella phaffii]|nr:GQ67_00668T0 [Komagataella phaffii]AOA67670.1 GQ68_00720T0 [Komagataella phaffii GS115]